MCTWLWGSKHGILHPLPSACHLLWVPQAQIHSTSTSASSRSAQVCLRLGPSGFRQSMITTPGSNNFCLHIQVGRWSPPVACDGAACGDREAAPGAGPSGFQRGSSGTQAARPGRGPLARAPDAIPRGVRGRAAWRVTRSTLTSRRTIWRRTTWTSTKQLSTLARRAPGSQSERLSGRAAA
jgi:hypothetical protein